MSAVFKREFNAYFTSPIGYVFIAMFYCLSGFFFFLDNLAVGSAEFGAADADFDHAHAQ